MLEVNLINKSGRIEKDSPLFNKWGINNNGYLAINLVPDGKIKLTQQDIRELQKAKGAIRAAVDILMKMLNLQPNDLEHFYLTGSFGGQINISSIIKIGMIPPVKPEIVEGIPNGAGLGAAMFLTNEGMVLAEKLVFRTKQIDLDQDTDFINHYLTSMEF
jgi:uncharacterized 2Fe-2S/4Fe-4S cluster protein (DUF4445 family)